jgi:hypothetical protein
MLTTQHNFRLISDWQHFAGHCQVTYQTKNAHNESIYYCLQDNGINCGGVKLLRCSDDCEPSHEVRLKKDSNVIFERPTGDSRLEKLVNEWIDNFEKETKPC